jgi:hypothetical protein
MQGRLGPDLGGSEAQRCSGEAQGTEAAVAAAATGGRGKRRAAATLRRSYSNAKEDMFCQVGGDHWPLSPRAWAAAALD